MPLPALYRRLALHPTLHVGRAYMDGTLTIAEGQLSDFLNLLLINEQLASQTGSGALKRRLEELARLAAVINPPERARRNVHHHYDHAANFYRCFLDEDLQYSCAYFANEALSLEEAQEAKKRHIAAKLDLRPGHRVLDIGCGFGGMALFLARNYGVHVTGITLSTEQLKIARERAAKQGLARLVDFRLEDYRHTRGPFDRIVSVGMFEHVGRPHYSQFFSRLGTASRRRRCGGTPHDRPPDAADARSTSGYARTSSRAPTCQRSRSWRRCWRSRTTGSPTSRTCACITH